MNGRFKCSYNGIWFYGSTEEEAMQKRDEYIQNSKHIKRDDPDNVDDKKEEKTE